ncbi:hypothetical protein ES332_A04G027400v1 [Gossypium tomentosum]|uniref:Disease resistance protein At4g27190-like leucine-rich repeats domain-containing protein n=1 Tax=Gossypium tomentosum TaxID=34277 RepID=A0A5D2QUC9_GOSTO|nr:hypothetical protein ES332_A04G027400v1 [Gossypium tomentosum]
MKNHYSLFWPKLESIKIESCENLKYLCSSTLAQRLPNLNYISIKNCPRLIQVFNMETNKDEFELQTPQLVEQDAIEETITDAIFNKNINWSRRWGWSQLPHIT